MLITDSSINYLADVKDILYRYFKAAFGIASREPDFYGHQIPKFRINNVSDVAKVWLQLLQPWRAPNEFVEACIKLN